MILKDLQSAGNAGEYYTPRAVTKFMTQMIDPRIGETVFDPACGTGGFLVDAIEHIKEQSSSIEDLTPKPNPFALRSLMWRKFGGTTVKKLTKRGWLRMRRSKSGIITWILRIRTEPKTTFTIWRLYLPSGNSLNDEILKLSSSLLNQLRDKFR